MMRFFNCILSLFLCASLFAMEPNLALHLDGVDNDVRTGIGILEPEWTLEAWIKGDDLAWKELEVIFGGGEYSTFDDVDNLPLALVNGRLCNQRSQLFSGKVLDDTWHHVAISCNGKYTSLYLDGECEGVKESAFPIIPGAIGINVEANSIFGGLIDEVRVWSVAIPDKVLLQWKNRPLMPQHPCFTNLVAYYNFDEGIEDMAINWQGQSVNSYHLRNGRACYGDRASLAWQNPDKWQEWMRNIVSLEAPLAYTVPAQNPHLRPQPQKTSLFNAVILENEWDVEQGTQDEQVIKLRIILNGQQKALALTQLKLNLSELSDLNDIDRLHVYYAGKTPRSGVREEISLEEIHIQQSMTLRIEKNKVLLTPGVNYILVTADVSPKAIPGNKVRISVDEFKMNGKRYVPSSGGDIYAKQIVESRHNNPNIVNVLQWNIWNGGIHLGDDGQERIIDLLKDADADIITMQEAYGAQARIAQALGYNLTTSGPVENLALYTRFPIIEKIRPSQPFNSNPSILGLPSGRQLLVNSLWIRFAHHPSYSGSFRNKGYNTKDFVKEDATRGLVDLKKIWIDDIRTRVEDDEDLAIMLSGDFNSGSHLDWTEAASCFHGGYGPVSLPISKYMIDDLGFKDSYRVLHPNECKYHDGTFAVIYGQLLNSRIDYTYYRGRAITPLSAKIVRTTYEIDDVWPSDHAGYMTYYEIKP